MDRTELIKWILQMKNGIPGKTTPHPDYAREALRWYAKTLPWWDLFDGVKEAMQHEIRQGGRESRTDR